MLNSSVISPAIGPATSPASSTSSFLIPSSQEFVVNGGLCLLYQLPNPSGAFTTSTPIINACSEPSPSTLLSISPSPPHHTLMSPNYCSPSIDLPLGKPATDHACHCHSSKAKEPSLKEDLEDDLDLELRLGQRPMPSS
jgi:hypothetical protein